MSDRRATREAAAGQITAVKPEIGACVNGTGWLSLIRYFGAVDDMGRRQGRQLTKLVVLSALCTALSSGIGRLAFAQAHSVDYYFVVPGGTDVKAKEKIMKDFNVSRVRPVAGYPGVERWTLPGNHPPMKSQGAVTLLGDAAGDPKDLFSSVISADQMEGSNIPPEVQERVKRIVGAVKGPSLVVTFDGLTPRKLDHILAGAHPGVTPVIRFNADISHTGLLALQVKSATLAPGGKRWSGVLLKGDTSSESALAAFPEESSSAGLVSFSYQAGAAFAQIDVDGKMYSIQPVGAGYHLLTPIDWSAYPEGHPHLKIDGPREEPRSKGTARRGDETPSLALDAGDQSQVCASQPAPTLRVGFTFTAEAMKDLAFRALNDPIAKAWISTTIQSIVSGFAAANVSVDLQSAPPWPYAGTTETNASDPEAQWDNQFADLIKDSGVAGYRKVSKVDLVVLVAHVDNSYACGGSPMGLITGEIPFSARVGFSLVSSLAPCSNPAYYTVMHEISHQLGLAHDEDATSPPTISKVDPVGRGFVALTGTSPTASKVTVEGYPSSCAQKIKRLHPELSNVQLQEISGEACGRIPKWSNSHLDPNDGQIGQAGDADSASVIRNTVLKVCGYKLQL